MNYEVLGFNQEKVIEAKLDVTDLMLLNYIITSNGNPFMEHIIIAGVSYVWLYHEKIHEDLPILGITEGTLKNRLSVLKQKGLIMSETQRLIKGSKTYYSVSELTMSFINDVRCHSKMTSDNNISNNISKNDNSIRDNTNKQQELFNTNNINNNKEVLEVRKSGQWFVDTYNSICVSLPKCVRLTAKRSKGISNILKKFTEEEILAVFNNLENSDFCKGKNDRGWRASMDFILNEDKFVYTLEGRYNSKRRCNVEEISNDGPKYRVSAEEKEEMRKAVERGELKEY